MERLLVNAFGTLQYYRFKHKELEAFFNKHNIKKFNWIQNGGGNYADIYIHLTDGFRSDSLIFDYGAFDEKSKSEISSGEHYIFYRRKHDNEWHLYEADLIWNSTNSDNPRMEGKISFGLRVTDEFVSKYKKKKEGIPSYNWDFGTTKQKKKKFEITKIEVGDKVVWEKEIEEMKFLSMMMLATKL